MVHKIIGFNHISDSLSYDEVNKLKTLYRSYHRLLMCYKWKYKRLRRLKLSLELSSIGLTTVGAVVGGVTLNPIILGSLTGSGIMIQAYLTKSNLNRRVDRCRFAFTSYERVLVQLKSFLRGLPYDESNFLTDLKVLDDIVIDQCPSADKYYDKYNKIFINIKEHI